MNTCWDGPTVFAGSGEMHSLIRTHDWSTSPIGRPNTWPQALCTIFGMVLDSKIPMSIVWGPERVLLYNESYVEFLGGKHPNQALGHPIADVWPEIWSDIGPLIDRAASGDAFYLEDVPLTIQRNGIAERAWFTFAYSPVRDDTGAFNGMCSQVLETTSRVRAEHGVRHLAQTLEERVQNRTAELEHVLAERAQAQEALVEQKQAEYERLYNIFRHAPGWVNLLRGPNHVFEQFNDAYLKLVGNREILGKPVREVFPDLQGQGFFELLDRVFTTGQPGSLYNQKIVLQRPEGGEPDVRYIDVVYEPIRESDGSISGIFSQGTDVTEQRKTEHALRRLNETLERRVKERTAQLQQAESSIRSLVDSVHQYIVMADKDGRLRFSNQAALDGINASLSDVIGVPLWQAPWFADSTGTSKYIEEAFQAVLHGAKFREEITLNLSNGRRIFDFALKPIRDVAGNIVTILTEGVDITERRQAEAALHQAQKMEAVGQLTSGLAHDFNNMLASVIGNLELMRLRLTQGHVSEIGRHIDSAMSAADRASALTHRLLAFSRRQTLDPKVTDVCQLMSSMVQLIERTVGPSIQVLFAHDAKNCFSLCDPNQLENALLNLAINARDAMPDGGQLRLEATNCLLDASSSAVMEGVLPGEYTVLSVTDSGTGMTPQVASRAFDPFFTTKPIGQGTGLGLSMIFGFVKQSKGHIEINTAVGEGTAVRIYLPTYHGEVEVSLPTATLLSDSPQDDDKTILIVDDEESLRELLAIMLTDLGYTVLQAPDAYRGLEVLNSTPHIDLLVSDVGLPGQMNGRQLADAAREVRPDLGVLFITGYAEKAVVGNGLMPPRMEVMTKPFPLTKFAEKVRTMIEMETER